MNRVVADALSRHYRAVEERIRIPLGTPLRAADVEQHVGPILSRLRGLELRLDLPVVLDGAVVLRDALVGVNARDRGEDAALAFGVAGRGLEVVSARRITSEKAGGLTKLRVVIASNRGRRCRRYLPGLTTFLEYPPHPPKSALPAFRRAGRRSR